MSSILRRCPRPHRESSPHRAAHARGQSLVEFTLVVPTLLVLLLAVSDFGRLFAAGITVDAASRDGAEAAAQQYVQLARGGATIDYAAIRATAARVACSEAGTLANVTVDGSGECVQPAIAVCVHDQAGGDSGCGSVVGGADVSSCSGMQAPWASAATTDVTGLPYVEVRMCYRFTLLIQTVLLPAGPIFLQQSSDFVAANY